MSDFWVKKMRTYFRRIDFDHDGSLCRDDFVAMGNRFAESGLLQDDKASRLKTSLTDIWDMNLKVAGHQQAISEDAFVEVMRNVAFKTENDAILRGPLPLFFVAVDGNQDGNIELDEYEKFFDTLGMDKNLAKQAFNAIDDNNDGVLNEEEFVTAGVQFFTSKEDDNSKFFWGNLV